MSLLDELHPASYKGVPFYLISSSISGGRKDIKHEFPNSDQQKIEDLGLRPKIFSVSVLIAGNSYIQDRDKLIEVLEQGGPGIFVHPWFGRMSNYVARTYTLLENLTELGEARFDIEFELTNTDGVPTKARNTLSEIESAHGNVLSNVSDDFSTNHIVTLKFLGNFASTYNKIIDVTNKFSKNTAILSASSDAINTFNKNLNGLGSGANQLVTKPDELIENILGLFSDVENMFNVTDTVAVMSEFFTFGDDDIVINPTTAGLAERLKSRNVFNQSMQTVALSYSYFNSAQIEFDTVSEIDSAVNNLEVQYQKIVGNSGLTDDTKSTLTDLRTIMQEFFDEQRLNAKQIITINTNLTSARLLSYQYYGDSTQYQSIVKSNVFDNVSFIEGDVKILTK